MVIRKSRIHRSFERGLNTFPAATFCAVRWASFGGRLFADVGRCYPRYVRLLPRDSHAENLLTGEVIAAFVRKSITKSGTHLRSSWGSGGTKSLRDERFESVMRHYSDVPIGAPIALFSSSGYSRCRSTPAAPRITSCPPREHGDVRRY